MGKTLANWFWGSISVLVLAMYFISGLGIDKAIAAGAENAVTHQHTTVVIDAGHGGEDGGATSCSGVLESDINLQISKRLNDLMHLVGIQTVMIRTSDESIYTQGQTIAQRKISDLKERVRAINAADKPLLISIHQNHFPDSRYKGAQVFYSGAADSASFARNMQSALIATLNEGSNRSVKKAAGIYLMDHIACTGILIECGFLSNPEEEALLRDPGYQKKLCCVITSVTSGFLHTENTLS